MDRQVARDDQFYMKEALRLAAKGRGRTSPNPMVGSVIALQDRIVGKGYHQYLGGPHAEINALRDAGERARAAVLYVTLEPCNHFGRTPPCTQAILDAGISRVVVGMRDPNVRVKGGGVEYLREQGLIVETGVLEKQCRLLNQSFIKNVTRGIPYVTLKAAMTLDGCIAARTGDSRWISNESSRRFVHRLRRTLDGILVGIGTALADDPMLTARMDNKSSRRQPVRIVLDTSLSVPMESQLVRTAREVPVWVACGEDTATAKAALLTNAGVKLIRLPAVNGRIDLNALLGALYNMEIGSLLVEGGAHVLGNFLEQRLADDFCFFYAPKILADPQSLPAFFGKAKGSMAEALEVYDIRVRRFGSDVMLSGRFNDKIY